MRPMYYVKLITYNSEHVPLVQVLAGIAPSDIRRSVASNAQK